VTVYPERCWYGVRSHEDVQRLVEGHLVGGEVVADLLIKAQT
jgi:(2Fe-2S) ferredoxin